MATAQSKRSSAKKRGAQDFFSTPLGKKVVVSTLAVVAFGSLVAVVLLFPNRNPGTQNGVGADGFNVSELKDVDLGVTNTVSRQAVQDGFGDLVKNVQDVDTSGVLNYNGNKGQTATYYLTTKAGTNGSFYIDVMQYKDQDAFDSDNTNNGTADAGKINGLAARYMHASTLANEREYALLVTKGLNSYKFALTQPYNNITIDEVTAQDALKRIAAKATLK